MSTIIGTFSTAPNTADARHEQRRQAARRRFHEYPAGDLETRSGYLVDRASGALFTRIDAVVFAESVEPDNEGRDVAGFYSTGTDLVFFKRAQGHGRIQHIEGLSRLLAEIGEHVVHIDLLPIGAPRRDWQTTVISDGLVALRHHDLDETIAMADRVGIELQLYAG